MLYLYFNNFTLFYLNKVKKHENSLSTNLNANASKPDVYSFKLFYKEKFSDQVKFKILKTYKNHSQH